MAERTSESARTIVIGTLANIPRVITPKRGYRKLPIDELMNPMLSGFD
jgi:hypothetical protein